MIPLATELGAKREVARVHPPYLSMCNQFPITLPRPLPQPKVNSLEESLLYVSNDSWNEGMFTYICRTPDLDHVDCKQGWGAVDSNQWNDIWKGSKVWHASVLNHSLPHDDWRRGNQHLFSRPRRRRFFVAGSNCVESVAALPPPPWTG